MSEARKCDRCHGYFELSEEEQKDRRLPYDVKGTYVKIMLFGRYGEVENSVRWYDLCPNCMELLDKWLENPDIDVTDCADRSNGATEKELELASKLNDAKIYIAQLKSELGYTMTKEEIEINNKKLISPTNEIECPYTKCNECGRFKEEYHELMQFKYFVCERCGKAIHKGYQVDEITPEIIKKDGIKIQKGDDDISEAAKFVKTKSSEAEYKDPCKSWHDGVCEQCCYGYCSEEDKKKRWLERHKEEAKLSDPYEEGGL